MIDYTSLEKYYDSSTIKKAVTFARTAAMYSQTREAYFPESMGDFYPHLWVIDAICFVLEMKE